jgi:hypothetical protein
VAGGRAGDQGYALVASLNGYKLLWTTDGSNWATTDLGPYDPNVAAAAAVESDGRVLVLIATGTGGCCVVACRWDTTCLPAEPGTKMLVR